MAGQPIDFYFDLASPYGYLAHFGIDGMAAKHGRSVVWRPYLIGAVFKVEGSQPLTGFKLKGPYAVRDMARSARLLGVPLQFPPGFPYGTVPAARAYYWLFDSKPDVAKAFAKAFYRAYFGEGRDVSPAEATADVAASVGVDRAALLDALQQPAVKDRLRIETDAAMARGVFGSPYFIVDGEPFWGADRLEQVDLWLQRGGW